MNGKEPEKGSSSSVSQQFFLLQTLKNETAAATSMFLIFDSLRFSSTAYMTLRCAERISRARVEWVRDIVLSSS
ncbi:hypothetical protein E2C01_041283 [Portunus trituberculatus]|uniref:Uncharacterized protein n=1 Tax=Portunus trituberculatus TaxID=210409 RepID=A0A5B7FT53_PORTR|nr:hypothetical protein [Portunus trituberculatus]